MEVRIGRSAQQPIQFVQLAALALPSHPLRLHVAPDAATVEQEEAVTGRTLAVKSVQSRNASPAIASNAASPAVFSVGASVQSESNAKYSSPSGEAR